MLLMVKYSIYYYRAHYHYLRMEALLRKQSKNLLSMSDKRFKKTVEVFLMHSRRFSELQPKLDTLKDQICNNYPDLREES